MRDVSYRDLRRDQMLFVKHFVNVVGSFIPDTRTGRGANRNGQHRSGRDQGQHHSIFNGGCRMLFFVESRDGLEYFLGHDSGTLVSVVLVQRNVCETSLRPKSVAT